MGDFNGDSRTDYARIGPTGAWVYRGNANSTFTQSFHAYGGWDFGFPSPYQLIVGDFNGDERTDYRRLSGAGSALPARAWRRPRAGDRSRRHLRASRVSADVR